MSFDFSTLITDRTAQDVSYLESLLQTDMDTWTDGPTVGRAVVGEAVLGEGVLPWFLRGSLRGAYTHVDLNRVGACLQYLSAQLAQYGYNAPVTARTNWTDEGWNNPADSAAYLRDVETVRSVFAVFDTTPKTPARMGESSLGAGDGLTYSGANDIEKILQDVHLLFQSMLTGFVPCGEAICGGDNL